jgi:NADH-quinone oxidoreductase subunit A
VSIVLWPILVYFGAVLLIVSGMLVVSYLLGQRHREHGTVEPYESGIASTGSATLRFDASFYLVAMFFVIFDLESMFLFAWAAAIRETGWQGYADVVIFVSVLVIALAYLWRVGALDWVQRRHSRHVSKDEGQWM